MTAECRARGSLWHIALATVLVATVVAACSSAPESPASDGVRSAGGLVVYLGIVPAALIRGHEAGTIGAMHGNPDSTTQSHHVMVAVFDATSGARITASRVTATLRPADGATSSKLLEPMTINNALTYGNYFTLPDDGTLSSLEVRIERPQAPAIVVTFSFRHLP